MRQLGRCQKVQETRGVAALPLLNDFSLAYATKYPLSGLDFPTFGRPYCSCSLGVTLIIAEHMSRVFTWDVPISAAYPCQEGETPVSSSGNPNLPEQVVQSVQAVIATYRGRERLILCLLSALVLAGILLLICGAAFGNWPAVTGGGISAALVRWPIKQLIALHRETSLLAIIPVLVQMTDATEARKLMSQFVRRLIKEEKQ